MSKKLPPIHPGELLLEEFLKPLHLSQYRLAHAMQVPPRRINEIIHGKRGITADTALRLSKVLQTTPQYWLNLQSRHEMEVAEDLLEDRVLKKLTPLFPIHKIAA